MNLISDKVLLVDDSKQLGSRVREMLKEINSLSFIGQAYTIDDGIKMFDEQLPGVVILDIGFKAGSGILLIPEIKLKNKNTMVIMFTNYSHSVYRKKCLSLGADFFFDKSTEYDSLLNILEKRNSNEYSA